VVVFHADDDKLVGDDGRIVAEQLGARRVELAGRGRFMQEKFPELLECLEDILALECAREIV